MVRYLEQLAELYWWRFSGLVIIFGILAFVLFILMAQTILNWLTGA